jgi:hypothetical protein
VRLWLMLGDATGVCQAMSADGLAWLPPRKGETPSLRASRPANGANCQDPHRSKDRADHLPGFVGRAPRRPASPWCRSAAWPVRVVLPNWACIGSRPPPDGDGSGEAIRGPSLLAALALRPRRPPAAPRYHDSSLSEPGGGPTAIGGHQPAVGNGHLHQGPRAPSIGGHVTTT